MKFNRQHAHAILPPYPRKAVTAALEKLPGGEGSVWEIIEEAIRHPDTGCPAGLVWALKFLRDHRTGETLPAMLMVLEALLATLPPDSRSQEELRGSLIEEIEDIIAFHRNEDPESLWTYNWRQVEGSIPLGNSRRPYDWSISLPVRRVTRDTTPGAAEIRWGIVRLDILRLLDDDVHADYRKGKDWAFRRADNHVIEIIPTWSDVMLWGGKRDVKLATVRRLLRDLAPALEASAIAALGG